MPYTDAVLARLQEALDVPQGRQADPERLIALPPQLRHESSGWLPARQFESTPCERGQSIERRRPPN